MGNINTIKYKRHEYLSKPKICKCSLLIFVYDVPYLDACGVFPPFHILNQIFLSGGGDGGMSPGASWEPFSISIEEYDSLVEAIKVTPISEIKPYARYSWLPFIFDKEFDHISERYKWMMAVCEKHRDEYQNQLKKLASKRMTPNTAST